MAKKKSIPEMSEKDFEEHNVKVRISIFLDGDVLDKAKERAKAEGMKYQTYINSLLRKALLSDPSEDLKTMIVEAVREALAKPKKGKRA